MKKVIQKVVSFIIAVITLVMGVATVNADVAKTSLKYAAASGLQYAIFPASTVYVSQTSYSGYSHAGKNVTDIVPTSRVYAPFDCHIVYIDKSWGYVIVESDYDVIYADGTVGKMCVGFMHDNDISDLRVGMSLVQGQAFYDKGTKAGSGGSKITGAHVHVIVMRGAFTKSMKSKYSSRGNVNIYDAFWLTPDTRITKSGYDQNKWRYLNTTVEAKKPTLTVTRAFNAPTTLNNGKNFGLRGICSVDVGVISSVTAYIQGFNGTEFTYQSNPNSKQFDIRYTVNEQFLFNRLKKGTYVYFVEVKATNGDKVSTYTFSRYFTIT